MPVVNYDSSVNDKSVVLWSNFLEITGNTYLNDDPAHPAINALTDSTYDYWRQASGAANTYIRKIGGAPWTAGALGISGHNLGTTGSTIVLSTSTDGGTTWGPVFPSYSPTSDADILFVFPDITTSDWEILIFGGTGAIVSVLKLGQKLVFPCTPVDSYTPTHHARHYGKMFNRSIKGHLLGNRVMSGGMETTVEFPFVNRGFVDGPLLGFEDAYNKGRGFFYAGWPNGKAVDCSYAWAGSEEAIVNVTYIEGEKLADLSFSMQGYVPV